MSKSVVDERCPICNGSGKMPGPSIKHEVEQGVFMATADFGGKETCGRCNGTGIQTNSLADDKGERE